MTHPEYYGLKAHEYDESEEIGDITMRETEQPITEISRVPSELLDTYEQYMPDKKYFVFCSDDRPLTAESARDLDQPDTFANPNNAIRTFGAALGSARATAVALFASTDESVQKTIAPYRGNFVEWTKKTTADSIENSNLVPSAHSAEKNEDNPEHFNPDSDKGPGCAYMANAEAVTEINTSPEVVTFASDVIQMLGSSPLHLAKIVQANERVKNHFSVNGGKTFNLTRDDAKELEMPMAIVEGDHASVEKARIVINLGNDVVSNPRTALELDMPTYNVDPVIECSSILKSNPELDARLLLESKILDICATAEALASSEGKHAWDFRYERIGNFEDAVALLEQER